MTGKRLAATKAYQASGFVLFSRSAANYYRGFPLAIQHIADPHPGVNPERYTEFETALAVCQWRVDFFAFPDQNYQALGAADPEG
jgi:hypothetical protein